MQAVLGIDAAWTLTQPSGVAAATWSASGWRLRGVADSYQRFHCLANRSLTPETRPSGSAPDAALLLSCVGELCRTPIELVAVDLPLAYTPIIGRRASDSAVSRAYGARHCATHTPTALRPGPVSLAFRDGLAAAGYPLLTDYPVIKGVIEVYPHPALVELAQAKLRLPYKLSRVRNYWPAAKPLERRRMLFKEWRRIIELLQQRISGTREALPLPDDNAPVIQLKSFEDRLDAVTCCWVAICALEGHSIPYGDENSAIWIPAASTPRSRTSARTGDTG
jgi:predicted RNase H-like nuclease